VDQPDLASSEGAYTPKNIMVTGGAGFMWVREWRSESGSGLERLLTHTHTYTHIQTHIHTHIAYVLPYWSSHLLTHTLTHSRTTPSLQSHCDHNDTRLILFYPMWC
jgi:hypothetical protein